jgi:transcriptional regulator with XRE-family HTH domain
MSIGERVRQVRKNSRPKMTQKEFGERLGVSMAVITSYELDRVVPPEPTIRLMCSTFAVDYDWLKYGQGDMYPSAEDAVLAALDDLMTSENEETKALIRALARMDDSELAAINKLIRTLKEELR